ILRAEYGLLGQCEWFKNEFDQHAKSCGNVRVPAFYFNFANSILGELKPSPRSQSRIVPFYHFIATRLLPCGQLDGGVKKFTGNEEIGEATDNITKAIHAFAHFTHLYSGGQLLFCDLQGMPDSAGKMCLFDPQSHSCVSFTTHLLAITIDE
ncbi:kinase-like domain-containing protein, partial [Infundibulicybe gibba]